jgi:hypothetical protein
MKILRAAVRQLHEFILRGEFLNHLTRQCSLDVQSQHQEEKVMRRIRR